jgi:hypothetical protein
VRRGQQGDRARGAHALAAGARGSTALAACAKLSPKRVPKHLGWTAMG